MNLKIKHYMDLMGIQTWHVKKNSDYKHSIHIFALLSKQQEVAYLFVNLHPYQENSKQLNLLSAIFAAFNLEIKALQSDFVAESKASLKRVALLVTMGAAAKKYLQHCYTDTMECAESVLETMDLDDILQHSSKKKLVWEDLKMIAKLIKSNK